jgi:hypothetical protein
MAAIAFAMNVCGRRRPKRLSTFDQREMKPLRDPGFLTAGLPSNSPRYRRIVSASFDILIEIPIACAPEHETSRRFVA